MTIHSLWKFALKDQVDEDQMQLVDQASNKHDPIYRVFQNIQAISRRSMIGVRQVMLIINYVCLPC